MTLPLDAGSDQMAIWLEAIEGPGRAPGWMGWLAGGCHYDVMENTRREILYNTIICTL